MGRQGLDGKKGIVSSKFLDYLCYAIVSLSVAIITFESLMISIDIPTFHMDGNFQTASGLFRLDSGQMPGRDFYPYIGLGPLLSVFPFYKIGGGNLSAAVFAGNFATTFFSWLAVSILWHFSFRSAKLSHSLAGGALVLIGFDFLVDQLSIDQLSITKFMTFGMHAGNSLRPLRAIIPYLVAVSIYFLIKRPINTNIQSCLVGVPLGVALLWSNDFSLQSFVFFYIFFIFWSRRIRGFLIVSVASFLVWFVLLFFITAGHPLDLLMYNFFDVAGDQWWYFYPYNPEHKVFRISQLSRIFDIIYIGDNGSVDKGSGDNVWWFFWIFVFVSALAIKTRHLEYSLICLIGLTVFVGGIIASVVGHAGNYFEASFFWSVATLIIFSIRLLKYVSLIVLNRYFAAFRTALLILTAFLFVLISTLKIFDYNRALDSAQNDPRRFYVHDLGGFLDIAYRDYLTYALQHRDQVVVEEYWGIWSAFNRSFSPWKVDSVIHALGRVRESSRIALKDVDLIVTTRYSLSPGWQSWSLSQNFWLYDEIISQWQPSFISPTTIVWKRQKIREFKNVECQISANKQTIRLNPGSVGFYRVTLNYSSSSTGIRHILMFKNNVSPLTGGFVSLQPGKHSARIPVYIRQEGDNEFYFETFGEANVEISYCFAEKILYDNEELFGSFYLTDENWIKGIARRWAGFFTHNTASNRSMFQIGRFVIFQNGDKRMITAVQESGPYLNVWVDGDILNPSNVGSPNEFKVVDE